MINNFFEKTAGNHIEFILEGDAYYERYLNLIRASQKSVHLQTYIFENDQFGQDVIAELKNAVQRGVKVYLLIDSLGSFSFPEKIEIEIRAAGIYFSQFNFVQFKWLGQWGRRLHHKVLLIDYEQALIGGINVVSETYRSKDKPHQLDFAVLIKGPATQDLTRYCQLIFSKASQRKIKFEKDSMIRKAQPDGVELKISINDWIYRRWQITKMYSELTQTANKEIIILNSYFFPRRKFMKQLVQAAQRGVRVCLILPKISDWPSYILASQYLYSYFLKNGIEIYQWKKSILHGKLATIDGQWTTIGSFNLNYTGYQQNLEMNVDVHSDVFAKQVNLQLQEIIETGCEKIDLSEFIEKASFKTRTIRFGCYVILQLIANLSIGLAFQEERHRGRLLKVLYVAAALMFFILSILAVFFGKLEAIPLFIIGVMLVILQIILNNRDV